MGYDISGFQADVIERSSTIPVLVHFSADFSEECGLQEPILERAVQGSGGRWALAKVDIRSFVDIVIEYDVRSFPTLMLFAHGKVIATFIGLAPERALLHWLNRKLTDAPS